MFSLRETADGKFIYRCHECGWEFEFTAKNQVGAAEQAVAYAQSHQCSPNAVPTAAEKPPKAS